MIGKKCPMGHTELCDDSCAWFVKTGCAVVKIAESIMIKPKPASKRKPTKSTE